MAAITSYATFAVKRNPQKAALSYHQEDGFVLFVG